MTISNIIHNGQDPVCCDLHPAANVRSTAVVSLDSLGMQAQTQGFCAHALYHTACFMHCKRQYVQYRPAVGSPTTHLYLIPFVGYKVGPPNTDRRYFQCALCRESLPTTGVTDHHPPLWLLPINEEDICGALGPHHVGYVYQLMEGREVERREWRRGEEREEEERWKGGEGSTYVLYDTQCICMGGVFGVVHRCYHPDRSHCEQVQAERSAISSPAVPLIWARR